MTNKTDNELLVKVAEMQIKINSMEKENFELKEDLKEIKKILNEINEIVNKTKGGLKVVLFLGSLGIGLITTLKFLIEYIKIKP